MLRRINRLITEAARTPGFGIGKPAALKGDLSGYWSSRIDHEHRLVSTVERDVLIVVQCRHHY
jgi:toxin YoeB